MAATAVTQVVPKIWSSASTTRRYSMVMMMGSRRITVGVTVLFPTASYSTSLPVRASKPQNEELNSNTDDPDRAFRSQEDLNYLFKLGAGSVLGAIAIKYGSALFPEITRPNILQALIMISAPVIVAVLLLIKKSRVE